ncbi:MAG: zinc-ribbon domain-containing protein [Candidatus Thorarchaeota archaeon]
MAALERGCLPGDPMRVCPECGKANLPERKFCIRCGAKLVRPKRRKRAEPRPQVPETGTVTIGAEVEAKQRAEAAEAVAESARPGPKAEVVEEQWVRPSQVPKDRVRRTSKKKYKSEMEKAREAFARAEAVGLEETGSGVVETRMLRASEVRELLEESAKPLPPTEEPAVEAAPQDTAAAVVVTPESEAVETEIDETEVKILGSMSAIVDPGAGAKIASRQPPPEAAVAGEFRSSLYDKIEAEPPPIPAVEETEETVPETAPSVVPVDESALDRVTTCPKCGSVITIDSFEYPAEVYSAMGEARLKQARFFVVQGKYDEARKVIRVARALFAEARDDNGIQQVDKLIDSLARAA